MPVFLGFLWSAFAAVLPSLVGRVLLALGIGAVAYTGLDILVNQGEQLILDQLNAGGADVYGLLRYLGVVAAIKMHTATMLSIVAILMAEKSLKVVAKT